MKKQSIVATAAVASSQRKNRSKGRKAGDVRGASSSFVKTHLKTFLLAVAVPLLIAFAIFGALPGISAASSPVAPVFDPSAPQQQPLPNPNPNPTANTNNNNNNIPNAKPILANQAYPCNDPLSKANPNNSLPHAGNNAPSTPTNNNSNIMVVDTNGVDLHGVVNHLVKEAKGCHCDCATVTPAPRPVVVVSIPKCPVTVPVFSPPTSSCSTSHDFPPDIKAIFTAMNITACVPPQVPPCDCYKPVNCAIGRRN